MTTDRRFRSAAGAAVVRRAYRFLIDTHLPFAEQRTLTTAAGETFVLSAGSADCPPVLLMPGSGGVAASWGVEMAELGQTRRVHAIDLPGESGLSTPVRLPLQRGAHAHWLHEVASSLSAEPAAVVGVSLGGWVALDYAIAHPEAVRELVLFSPSGIGPRKVAPLLLAALLGTLGARGRRRALSYLLGPGRPAWTDAFHQDLGALALATFRHFRPRTDPIPTFTDDELRSLPPALTVVLGDRDRMLHGGRAAARLRRLSVAGRTELLSGQGHLVPQSSYLRHLEAPYP
ncbi:alpha/beta fold hydrolase [Pseudonocardia charpentierae]|uniref:Alpha/beta fold hydrolase n=1 Tax=Pseudonocardia charpentierae TaxID=3075545 RepID=A0ABU2NJP0_9PSEU|nr:alpha/beta fold hydrolase [Pseudonocardia sp. DSM 45834]MDT0353935.1 alpha/beta fold hydrolase [Pseudonocardia sp. DSM 45834]